MTSPVIHRIGTRSVLVDLPDLDTVMAWHAALSETPLPGQVDIIAAARTLLVTTGSPRAARGAAEALRSFAPGSATGGTARDITIDVVYDGDDLEEVADTLGLLPDALIAWHTGTTWVGAFGGFAPGFTYCVPDDDSRLRDVPRRGSPRTAVPAGAVGLAGGFSAVYPRESPGGWQLIGTTATPMWEADADSPALIVPGDRVRYRSVREQVKVPRTPASSRRTTPSRPVLRIDDAGLLTLLEDLGRAGHGDWGVTESGAADRAAARAVNAAVGNAPDAPVLENIGGLRLTALVDTVLAVAGAEAPVTVDGRPVPLAAPALLTAGSRLAVGPPTVGMRSYVGVRGGFVADEVLGSSSSDVLSGLGPSPVQPGAVLGSAFRPRGTVATSVTNPLRVTSPDGATTQGVLRCVPGPRDDWFADGPRRLAETTWTVSGQSNRVGLRLEGAALSRSRGGELPSEGMVAGSIQIPPNGAPVVFLRDHAVTGGYPVVATVVAEDLDIAAQLPPGATVTFLPVDPDTLAPLFTPAHATDPVDAADKEEQ